MRQPLSRKFKKIKKNQNFDAVALISVHFICIYAKKKLPLRAKMCKWDLTASWSHVKMVFSYG